MKQLKKWILMGDTHTDLEDPLDVMGEADGNMNYLTTPPHMK